MGYRNESRRSPGADRYGTPGTQYPTPNPYDVVITEEVSTRSNVFEPVLYGTPHPDVSAAVLCHQSPVKGSSTDKSPIRIYANPRLAQEPYNLVTGDDDANDPDYPTFVRSYLLPRGYQKATMGAALTALIGLTLVAGGSGYTPAANSGKLALSFSGGGGTGAAGFAEIVNGAVAAVVLTNSGTGYTSAPTVSIAGGTGGSITALLQPTTARLVDEVEQPAEEPFGGYFVRVQRTWETLPGKLTTRYFYDKKTNTPMHQTRQIVAAGTSVPALSTSGTTDLIVDAVYEPIDSVKGTMIITYLDYMPDSRVEAISRGFPFPGQFNYLSGWSIPPPCTVKGPYAGINYTLTPTRTASRPMRTTFSYQFGEPTLPDTWIVSSPGAASQFFPIRENTIHNAINSTEYCDGGAVIVTIEDLPASTPDSYSPGDTLVIESGFTENWMGKIWEKRVSTISETE